MLARDMLGEKQDLLGCMPALLAEAKECLLAFLQIGCIHNRGPDEGCTFLSRCIRPN